MGRKKKHPLKKKKGKMKKEKGTATKSYRADRKGNRMGPFRGQDLLY